MIERVSKVVIEVQDRGQAPVLSTEKMGYALVCCDELARANDEPRSRAVDPSQAPVSGGAISHAAACVIADEGANIFLEGANGWGMMCR
jgi:hypothetical protein